MKKSSLVQSLLPVLIISLLAVSAFGGNARKLILEVQQAPLAWADSDFEARFKAYLSRNPELRIYQTDELDSNVPGFPNNHFDLDSLFDWGTELGGRYVLVVLIDSERMERKKTFSLPLIFHRYEVIGTIEGEFRLLDIANRRLLAAEPFSVSLKGPRQFQGSPDDDAQDASLHIPAPERSGFFGRLEDKLVEKLGKKVRHYTRGR